MSTLHEAFARARREGRAALIGYLPSGFPSQAEGIALATAMVEAGVDIVEVGLPYSDPLMDGPVIQAAVHQALTGGSSLANVLATVEAVAATGAPTLVMSYWNPIERVGVGSFAARLARAGGVGVITPDLPPDEADAWLEATTSAGLDRVFLVAPSSTDARIGAVAGATTGFVYAASTMRAGRLPGRHPLTEPGPEDARLRRTCRAPSPRAPRRRSRRRRSPRPAAGVAPAGAWCPPRGGPRGCSPGSSRRRPASW